MVSTSNPSSSTSMSSYWDLNLKTHGYYYYLHIGMPFLKLGNQDNEVDLTSVWDQQGINYDQRRETVSSGWQRQVSRR